MVDEQTTITIQHNFRLKPLLNILIYACDRDNREYL